MGSQNSASNIAFPSALLDPAKFSMMSCAAGGVRVVEWIYECKTGISSNSATGWIALFLKSDIRDRRNKTSELPAKD